MSCNGCTNFTDDATITPVEWLKRFGGGGQKWACQSSSSFLATDRFLTPVASLPPPSGLWSSLTFYAERGPEEATVLPYVRSARARGWAAVVLNPNHTMAAGGGARRPIKGSDTGVPVTAFLGRWAF